MEKFSEASHFGNKMGLLALIWINKYFIKAHGSQEYGIQHWQPSLKKPKSLLLISYARLMNASKKVSATCWKSTKIRRTKSPDGGHYVATNTTPFLRMRGGVVFHHQEVHRNGKSKQYELRTLLVYFRVRVLFDYTGRGCHLCFDSNSAIIRWHFCSDWIILVSAIHHKRWIETHFNCSTRRGVRKLDT